MAWSPVRRTNAGRFEVEHPGDYATFNSYHPSDATLTKLADIRPFASPCDSTRYARAIIFGN
jgi:hypothetical protein